MCRYLAALVVLHICCIPSLGASPLDGHFYLSKPTFSAGEPIFLIFVVKNAGNQPVTIRTAGSNSICGKYGIEVEGAKKQELLDCYGGLGGSCASSGEVLLPGTSHTDRILVNSAYDLRQAGSYPLHVTHDLPYGPGNGDLTLLITGGTHDTFDAHLEVIIEPSQGGSLKPEFQNYVQNLQSSDPRLRAEAAQVISELSPPFLEGTIVQMLDSSELQYFAVRGLRNLGTPTAHRALENFVRSSPPTEMSGAYQQSIRYLGEIGDSSDLPLLLEIADTNLPGSESQDVALLSAGRVGGDDAVPLLTAKLKDQSLDVRQSVVRALYSTGSRTAVPVLIELLRSPEERLSGTAEYGLQVLTHRRATDPDSQVQPAATYSIWARWWNTHGEGAPVFRYDQCGDLIPLD